MAFLTRFVMAAGLVGVAGAAQAGLEICNDTGDKQSISIGYKGDDDWTSEGWWNVEPGECVQPVSGDLKKRYYYLRAEVDGGEFEGGNYYFCTTPTEYTIVGDTECESRGYDREDFVEIDTGETATHHVYRMTAGDMASRQDPDKFGLTFCNETEYTQAVSVGYEKAGEPVSEGWWNVEPGACQKTLRGALKRQLYYYRAEVNAGDFDGQGFYFCTTPEAYTIEGNEDCEGRGYDREDFREFDTGETAKAFTFTLVAAEGDPVPSTTTTTASDGGFRVCNETEWEQSVSVGYEGAEGWTSEGWWNLGPGECATPIAGPLDKQYFYYRSEVDGEPYGVTQNFTFCTTTEAYTIVGDTDCEARGYDKEGFNEVTLEAGATSHTLAIMPAEGDTGPATDPGPSQDAVVDNMADVGAGLEICNETAFEQSLSFGYNGAEGWTSEGWWNVAPGDCVTPALDGTNRRYVYYRAEVDGGDFAGQNYFFCTTPSEYTIVGDTDCESRGYDREDFYEIDTGGDEGMFTFTLVADAERPMTEPVQEAPVTDPLAGSTETPTDDGTTGTGDSGGGFDFDRQGDDAATVDETPDPEPEVEPEPEPEPSTPRRGGSRGG